ncbi:MAG: hypothetical protein ACPGWR_04605 [Ardenticatenaceae bacterium]
MKEQLAKLREFHETFECYLEDEPTVQIPREVFEVRVKLFEEELAEYGEAYQDGDLVEVADALTDMLYVLLGTFVTHGLQDVAINLFDEVHRSNMSKLDENGGVVRRADGKVLKSALYSPPDLERILIEKREK